MIFEQNFLGRNGFFWFIGVIEDRMDPLQLGRVRVRAHGWHTSSKTEIKTENLPWAQVIMPNTSASVSGVGSSPSGLVEGSWVVGFFLDGMEAQEPLIIGSFHGLSMDRPSANDGFSDPRTNTASAPKKVTGGFGASLTQTDAGRFPRELDVSDASKLTRGDTSALSEMQKAAMRMTGIPKAISGSYSEPASTYGAVYPYNHVIYESESGHVIEMDDTPGKERVNIHHRSGSHIEMLADGRVIIKSANDVFELCHASAHENVVGAKDVTVGERMKLRVGNALDVQVVDGNATINVDSGNANITVNGNVNLDVSGNYDADIGGTCNISSGGNMKFTAPQIDLN